ncbi:hypothetical protein D9758_014189 [Tetrapyrgos nigripes]|uniref:DUF1793-domain-containing protein n=1 Tax=Tetrapyrgos nigripes TaxID=182062 RepID=A0A8H5FNY5_9AGAR|nr:hypothetical protein D9758_014189 [Tetrapyrgos nigripes]
MLRRDFTKQHTADCWVWLPNFNLAALLFLLLLRSLHAQSTGSGFPQNFTPPSYPLAVRSPYLHAWIATDFNATDGNSTLTHDSPRVWDFNQALGWCGIVRVDNDPWQWLGPIASDSAVRSAIIQSSVITPTKVIFTMLAGPVTLNVSFFTPIEVEDLALQSLPFIYLSLDIQASDGQDHEIQVYSDISAEWVSGDRNTSIVQWNTTFTSSSMFHRAFLQNQQPMNETNNQAQDATVYYSMQLGQSLTWKTGDVDSVRPLFVEQGSLDNNGDTGFRVINDRLPVFAIAADLGKIQSTSQPVVWSLGVVRDPMVQYILPSEKQESRRPYFFSDPRFSSQKIEDVIDFFMQDYQPGLQRSNDLDARILQDAAAVSVGNEQEYLSLVSLSTRQVLAGFDITTGPNGDIKAFTKNTGISGVANNVPTLWASLPTFLYLNATWAKYLLDSSLQYQHSIIYGKNYAAPDIGGYPNVQGNNDDKGAFVGIEDTGLMLILTLTYAKSVGDTDFLVEYYDTLKSWAEYLRPNTLPPHDQQSSDLIGTTTDDYSILAIKGIIGIGAMSQISAAVGKINDEEVYSSTATSLAQQWQDLAVASDHITLEYNNAQSFALLYDLYADLLLETGLVNNSVYDIQTRFCQDQLNNAIAGGANFGIPLSSSSHSQARSSWSMLTAATMSNNDTRNAMVHAVYNRASFNQSGNRNFPFIYDIKTGGPAGGANAQQGAMFSLLALRKGMKGFSTPTNGTNSDPNGQPAESSKSKPNGGLIAGAVIGSLAGILLILALVALIRRRRQQQRASRRLLVAHSYHGPEVIFERTEPSSGAPPPTRRKNRLTATATPVLQTTTTESDPSNLSSQRPGKNRRTATPQVASDPVALQTQAATGLPPANTDPSDAQSDTSQLRNDVSLLRREIEQIKMQTEYGIPPPSYN